jgi:hypothetical protein
MDNNNQLHIETKIDNHQLLFMAVVFEGANYIPPSVRRCAEESPRSLEIDERYCRILFKKSILQTLVVEDYELVLKQFMQEAHEWRHILDEQGRQDLIYARVS